MRIIKKTILLVLLLTACMVLLAGCSKDKDDEDKKNNDSDNKVTETTVDMKQLKEDMLAADSSIPEMSVVYGSDENGSDLFSYLAEYNYENVEDYYFAYATAGTAEEVAVIRLKDNDSAEDCLKAVQAHVESRIIQFETYDPSQVERCEGAVVFSNENYVVLIISDNDEAVKEAFYAAFK